MKILLAEKLTVDIGQATRKSSVNTSCVDIYVFYISNTITISTKSLKRYFPIGTEYASINAYEILSVLKVSFSTIPYSEIKCPDFETKNDTMVF